MRNCPNCGSVLDENAKFCGNCGTKIQLSEQLYSYGASPSSCSNTSISIRPQMNVSQKKNSKATAALICGICSLTFSPTVFLGVILGVVAIVLGISSLKENYYTNAKVGKVCGIIGTALSVVAFLLYIWWGSMFATIVHNFEQAYDNDDITIVVPDEDPQHLYDSLNDVFGVDREMSM